MRNTILIVDDDPTTLGYLEQEMKRYFYKPICVSTGKDALAHIHEADLVFLDIKLPDMDGFEVLSKIRELNTTGSNCEVIIITGYGNQEIAIRALRMGAIDYIDKPLHLDDIRAAIGRAQEMIAKRENLAHKDTILVIDDDKDVSNKLRDLLVKEGYLAFCCYSGPEGLDLIAKNKIDVVVTDYQMGGMDGLQVLQNAKKLYQDIEVIMMTGHSDHDLAINSLRAGAINYLLKPINLDELLWSVQRAVEKIKLSRSSLYRNRELKLSAEIVAKMNQEQERIIHERSTELNKTQAQLFHTSKLATVGEMSAGMAHELNQPLGGMSLAAQTIRALKKRNMLSDEELDKSLSDIESSITRISKIIEHVRMFARQETLKFIQVDINKTIESALMLLGEQLRLHAIEVSNELTNNIPLIEGEPFQLEQVWINLISNARDALDVLGNDMNKKISIKSRTDGDKIIVEVKDNGIGMTKDQLHKVFEPFFTTKPPGKGMGLGMSISYGIVKAHDGKIEISSEKDKGTLITVSLPVRKIAAEEPNA